RHSTLIRDQAIQEKNERSVRDLPAKYAKRPERRIFSFSRLFAYFAGKLFTPRLGVSAVNQPT
ncbi:MAG TPA: hypothetical protein VNA22_04460, partial [Pyrinomonadaceae bacterium]|nr:hypothetical protein [Pyrinomonadaceae bacterium]